MSRGFRINMSVPELGQALGQISAYDGKAALGIENAVQSSTKAIGAGMRRRAPVKTGNLKKKIRTRFGRNKFGRGTIQGEAAAVTPYAHLVEFGAKATVVRPKTKKAMTIDAFGYRRYAKVANIPIRRERPFARPSFEDEKPNLIRAIGEAVKKP